VLDGSARCTAVFDEPCHRLYLAAAPAPQAPCGPDYRTGDIIAPPGGGVLNVFLSVARGSGPCVRRRHEPWSYPILAVGLPATVIFDVVTAPVWLTSMWLFARGMRE